MTRISTQAPSPRTQRGSPRMFESDFFEFFSRVHPAIPAILYLPLVAVSLWFAIGSEGLPVWRVAAEVVGGYLFWTLFEYWLHRLFFHLPVIGPKTERLHFFVHGVHHDYPWDETRLVIPPGASLGLCVVIFGAFRLIFGAHGMYGPFAGFVLGYVIYDSVHWYVHARAPRNRFGRWLRREHLVHHFKDPTSRFGVSCPWLDFVFGTRGKSSVAADTSPTQDEERPSGMHAAS
jgi:sterol desaturase/sphingolipid hydroxylase (fatty acid hydroxylase superfamily)